LSAITHKFNADRIKVIPEEEEEEEEEGEGEEEEEVVVVVVTFATVSKRNSVSRFYPLTNCA
jgi:hypothetical protein